MQSPTISATTNFFSFTNSPSAQQQFFTFNLIYQASSAPSFVVVWLAAWSVGRFLFSLVHSFLSLYITSSSLFSKSNDVKNNSSKVYYLHYIVYTHASGIIQHNHVCVNDVLHNKKGYLTDRLTSRKAFLYRRYFHMNEYNFLFSPSPTSRRTLLIFFSVPLYFRKHYYYLLYPKRLHVE